MRDDLPDGPFTASKLQYTDTYHTGRCRAVRSAKQSRIVPVSESTIRYHGLEECAYCSGEFDDSGGPTAEQLARTRPNGGVADD